MLSENQKKVLKAYELWYSENPQSRKRLPEMVYLLIDDVSIFIVTGIKGNRVRGRTFVNGKLSEQDIERLIHGGTDKPRYIRNINRYYPWDARIKYNTRRKWLERFKNIPTQIHPSLLRYERTENYTNREHQAVQRCFYQHLSISEHSRTATNLTFKVHGMDGKPLPSDIECFVQLYETEPHPNSPLPNYQGGVVISYVRDKKEYICPEEIPTLDYGLNFEACVRKAYPLK